jgi:hypothetical protein
MGVKKVRQVLSVLLRRRPRLTGLQGFGGVEGVLSGVLRLEVNLLLCMWEESCRNCRFDRDLIAMGVALPYWSWSASR